MDYLSLSSVSGPVGGKLPLVHPSEHLIPPVPVFICGERSGAIWLPCITQVGATCGLSEYHDEALYKCNL